MGLGDLLYIFLAASFLEALPKGRSLVDDCSRMLVSDTLPVLIEPGHLLEHLQTIQDIADNSHGDRRAGSHGHNQTINYIHDYLASQGYYMEVEPFHDTVPSEGQALLVVNDAIIDAEPINWSPDCNFSSRPIVPVDGHGCRAVDYPQEALGSIVLVSGGGCSLSDKSISAGIAGADGLLLYETAQLTPSFGGWNDYHIPSAKISNRDDAQKLLHSNYRLWINQFEVSTDYERIDRLECGNEDNTLLVGTHTDSVASSAGINDNASGIASLLEIATQLARFGTNSRVKFAFWTAGEPGLIGSKHWMDTIYKQELQKIRLYLDVNMLGSPNGALKMYDEVQVEKTQLSNRSDYAPFFEHGIPFAGLFSGADGLKTQHEVDLFGGTAGLPYDGYYHQPEDDTDNINMTTLFLNTKALAYAVGVYGRSFDSISSLSASAARSGSSKSMDPTGHLILLCIGCFFLLYLQHILAGLSNALNNCGA
ncbi:hypothetical protein F5Y04DRAFT_289164 [Hypomontagnella monticulosa]|nr:hypothetical protein F5Y04DRAFT_289164 [Hypomontagnella monticulosa]